MTKFTSGIVALICVFSIGCQNTSEQATTENKDSTPGTPADLPANTLRFKFNGNLVTVSNSVFIANGGVTIMGEDPTRYIRAETATVMTGTYDKNSVPKFSMFYVENATAYLSDSGTANMTFHITVTGTEVTGTFSGTLRRNNTADIIPVTDGVFRVTK